MFTETIIAVFLLGWLVAFAFIWLATVRPLERQLRAHDLAKLRESRQRLYRQQVRRQHLGTAYIVPAATGFEKLMADISDNDRWSRKAPVDLPDNVRSISQWAAPTSSRPGAQPS